MDDATKKAVITWLDRIIVELDPTDFPIAPEEAKYQAEKLREWLENLIVRGEK